jgi:hypothetical protein
MAEAALQDSTSAKGLGSSQQSVVSTFKPSTGVSNVQSPETQSAASCFWAGKEYSDGAVYTDTDGQRYRCYDGSWKKSST